MGSLPRLSAKELAVLELLISRGEMYGLEMVRTRPDDLKRGTVYVTLSRMEDKGYLDSRPLEDETLSGKPRRLYKPTGYGAQVLRLTQRYHEAVSRVRAMQVRASVP